jgi:hypothetical protein
VVAGIEVAQLASPERLIVGGDPLGISDPDGARPLGVPRLAVAVEDLVERGCVPDLDAPVERLQRRVHVAAEEHLRGLDFRDLDAVHVLVAVLPRAGLVNPQARVRVDGHGRILPRETKDRSRHERLSTPPRLV